ncbi:flagellar assembly protein A [Paenibacillus sp. BAC0078]
MAQHIMERSRYEFFASMLLGRPDLLKLYSVDAQAFTGTDRDKNGVIIIQNNEIFITSPLPGGKPAVISALHPVILKINQQTITAPTQVTACDQISWDICEKPQYQITVSDDKLKVYFTLYRAEKYAWNLVNTPASANVTVRAELNRDVVLSTLSIEQIIAGFEKSPLIGNLNIPALYEELNNPTYLPVCIAEGKAPVPGTDASLELLFPENLANEFNRGEQTAKETEHQGSPAIREGEVFARKLPPQEGLPGFDVFGYVLPPPPPQDITLIAGAYASLQPSGEITAQRNGRPRITGSGSFVKTVDFPEAHIIPEDGEPAAGTIMFPGDVVVLRDIEQHTVIEALGNVYIYGNVFNSTITATGSILVRGKVVDSGLYAGAFGVMHNRLCSFSKLLMQEVGGLREAARLLAETVESVQRTVKYGLVVLLLLENKYNHLPAMISNLQELLAGMSPAYPQDTEPLKRMLDIFLHPGRFTRFFTDNVLSSFEKLLMDFYDGIAFLQEENVRIDIAGSHGSIIKSGGNLHIHEEGITKSKLFSSDNIYFERQNSVCEYSTVEAAGNITAQTVGQDSASASALLAGGKITVCRICNTSVTVGEYSAAITAPEEGLEFTAESLQQRNQADTASLAAD